MTAGQEAAFRAASGAHADMVLAGIAGAIAVLALIWTTWIALGSLRDWRAGEIELIDLMWNSIRACIVLLLIGFYVR